MTLDPHPSDAASSLESNAFRWLGVTPLDDRGKIIEQAEERALHADPARCQKARADLTNPRTRLAVELAWFPGVRPEVATELLGRLSGDPIATALRGKLPGLARCNLMSAALESVDTAQTPPSTLADFMRVFGEAVDRLDPGEILADVNRDRLVAGFPEVRDTTLVEEELTGLKKHYKAAMKAALDAMPSAMLIDTMTLLVERATQSGTRPAPALVDDFVDSYAIETQQVLDREEANLTPLIEGTRAAARSGASAVTPLLDKVEQVVRNWTRIAKPIQLSAMARGMAHPKSQGVAYALRRLGIDLHNDHSLTAQAERMTALLRELFAEVGEVAERLAEDAEALGKISEEKKFSELIGPLRALCKSAAEKAESLPAKADLGVSKLAAMAPDHLSKFGAAGVPATLLDQVSDEVAQAIVYCTAIFAKETNQWARSVEMISSAKRFAKTAQTRERIEEHRRILSRNADMYEGLVPVKSAPSLFTLNGFGVKLYGKTDHDAESDSYMATYYFVALFIPIFPICRYRVISDGNAYRFLAKGPLRRFDHVHLAISIGLIAWMMLSK